MNILVIDDDSFRHQRFDDLYSGQHNLAHAYTYSQAINLLGVNRYDTIFLDHDLNGTFNEDPLNVEEKTGLDVAKWMIVYLPYRPKVYIHSMNPAGAQLMFLTLVDAGLRRPFQATLLPFHLLGAI